MPETVFKKELKIDFAVAVLHLIHLLHYKKEKLTV